jgi:protein-arginine kinase activator protein McsA
MKCDLCDQEATVQEIVPIKGKLVERHLCEECARTKGITTKPTISVPETDREIPPARQETSKGATKATSCPSCGTTYVEFASACCWAVRSATRPLNPSSARCLSAPTRGARTTSASCRVGP